MIIPVRCMTCGRVLGDKWEIFKKRVKKGENPKKVLDDLNIKNYCCRALFLTHKDISKEVAKFKRVQ
ncbi:MAG: DNA-directed RNA polymerase subunit N [Candidatus Aenigmarchaeota archaeon]|nr:DNA-directed RNA polymerase subunit N [Candidatus Aenigmarchaeota archaeon]